MTTHWINQMVHGAEVKGQLRKCINLARKLTLDLGEPPQFSSAHLQNGPGIQLSADKEYTQY